MSQSGSGYYNVASDLELESDLDSESDSMSNSDLGSSDGLPMAMEASALHLLSADTGDGASAVECRFCHHSATHPSYGIAMRVCSCPRIQDYMAHRGCFYKYILEHHMPAVCGKCQAPWTIPPAEYLPFYYHRKKVKAHNLQVVGIRTLVAFGLFLAMGAFAAMVTKGIVFWVSGHPTYVPFGEPALTVHWEPGLGDLVVGSIETVCLLVAAWILRALFRCACGKAKCCGCCARHYRPVYTDGGRVPARGNVGEALDEVQMEEMLYERDLAQRMEHYRGATRGRGMSAGGGRGRGKGRSKGPRNRNAGVGVPVATTASLIGLEPDSRGHQNSVRLTRQAEEIAIEMENRNLDLNSELDSPLVDDAALVKDAYELPLSDYESEDSAERLH